jgi:TolB-like protein/tetratricopeptide (TPR) repeat protein
MALREGERLGPYEVLGSLGAGGMGEVYRARDTRLGREVALKVLPEETAGDPDRLARFEREAQAVAALNHPNIVTLHGVEVIDGRRVIVMERVSGSPLSAFLEPRGLPLGRLLEIAVPVADALAAAHEKGVVHRDLKPANVMLSDEGRVKVLDFGLAKVQAGVMAEAGSEAPTDTQTSAGQVLGTIPYMSPEQLRGERVDTRADIFSFGAMLYEMAAGARPFPGHSTAEVMSAILREEPAPLATARPDLPPRFVRLVGRCLEKDPRRRIQSATDLRQQLQDLAEELRDAARTPVAPAASTPAVVAAGSVRRDRGQWVRGAVAVLVVALAGVGVWQWPRLQSRWRRDATAPEIRSLAVLPFDNLTHDAAQDYFVDGLHDALITELAKLGTLRVTSRNSVMRYKGKPVAMKDVARELGVDALVEGSVLRSGSRVRITAQLIRGSTDAHVWADSYDRDLQDVLALLTDVSRAIAGQVQARLGGPAATAGAPQPVVTPRVQPEAYEAYLRGRQVIGGMTSVRAFSEARAHFKQAVALEPGLAPAWAGLANAAAAAAFFRIAPVGESVAEARDAARKALAIDPSEGGAYGALGFNELDFDWDFEKARANVERSIALGPHDGMGRHSYADYLMVTGRFDESLEQVRLGREANPSSPLMQLIVMFHTEAARHPDALRREVRLTLERFPQMAAGAHSTLGDLLWRERAYEEALAEYRLAMSGGELRAFEAAFRRAGPRGALIARAEWLAKEADGAGRPPDWLALARCYAQAGEPERAFALLDKALASRTPQLLHFVADPAYDGLRDDPRYDELLRRIGVPMARGVASPASRRAGR